MEINSGKTGRGETELAKLQPGEKMGRGKKTARDNPHERKTKEKKNRGKKEKRRRGNGRPREKNAAQGEGNM